jgi:hypothetical protein
MGLDCEVTAMADNNTLDPGASSQQPPSAQKTRCFQLLPKLWVADARITLQNGLHDLWVLSELQRLLLTPWEPPT